MFGADGKRRARRRRQDDAATLVLLQLSQRGRPEFASISPRNSGERRWLSMVTIARRPCVRDGSPEIWRQIDKRSTVHETQPTGGDCNRTIRDRLTYRRRERRYDESGNEGDPLREWEEWGRPRCLRLEEARAEPRGRIRSPSGCDARGVNFAVIA